MRHHCAEIINKLPSHRLMALDVMRGLTITAMILVNNPGSWGAMYCLETCTVAWLDTNRLNFSVFYFYCRHVYHAFSK